MMAMFPRVADITGIRHPQPRTFCASGAPRPVTIQSRARPAGRGTSFFARGVRISPAAGPDIAYDVENSPARARWVFAVPGTRLCAVAWRCSCAAS